jgi:hypothetical protein
LVVFERFTDRARRVVVLAQEESRLLNHDYIGTEHLLLGLVHEGQGIAAQALESLGISLEAVRGQVEAIIGHGVAAPSGHIPFTPRAKKVLELSLREALQLGHNYIGTEHILLGLIREGEGVAAQVLVKLGADLSSVRQQVTQLLAGASSVSGLRADPTVFETSRSSGAMFSAGPAAPVRAPRCSFCLRDLWEVDHYVVGPGATMCDVCIAAARDALDAVSQDRHLLVLPPRVFGTPPAQAAGVIEEIVRALNAVFGAELNEQSAPYMEDGEELVPTLLAALARFPDTHVTEAVVERVRFSTPDEVSVGFALVLDTGERSPFVGTVIRVGTQWSVTRTTVADVLRGSGVYLPP